MMRAANRTDGDVIAKIYNHYILNTTVSIEESEVSGEDMSLRIDKVQAPGLPWLVAEEHEIVIGYAYATRWHERSAYRHTVEISAYLAESAHSRGWGTQLYNLLFDELRNLNIHVVIAGITLPNAASVALHEKFGMTQVAHFAEVGFKFGDWLDVGYWQTTLNSD